MLTLICREKSLCFWRQKLSYYLDSFQIASITIVTDSTINKWENKSSPASVFELPLLNIQTFPQHTTFGVSSRNLVWAPSEEIDAVAPLWNLSNLAHYFPLELLYTLSPTSCSLSLLSFSASKYINNKEWFTFYGIRKGWIKHEYLHSFHFLCTSHSIKWPLSATLTLNATATWTTNEGSHTNCAGARDRTLWWPFVIRFFQQLGLSLPKLCKV